MARGEAVAQVARLQKEKNELAARAALLEQELEVVGTARAGLQAKVEALNAEKVGLQKRLEKSFTMPTLYNTGRDVTTKRGHQKRREVIRDILSDVNKHLPKA